MLELRFEIRAGGIRRDFGVELIKAFETKLAIPCSDFEAKFVQKTLFTLL